MRKTTLTRFSVRQGHAAMLTACPQESSDPGPTGPPGQPDTTWAKQMSDQHKAQKQSEQEAQFKSHRDQGMKLSENPEERIKAITYLESALNLAKKTAAPESDRQAIVERLAQLHRNAATDSVTAKDFADARISLLKAEALKPGQAEVAKQLAIIEAHARQVLETATKLQAKQPNKAIEMLADALACTDSASKIYEAANSLRGKLLAEKEKAARDAEVAQGSFDKAGATDAMTRAKALRADGIDFQKKGEYQEAIERYKESLDLNPDDHDLNRLIGACYALLHNRKEAAVYYKRFTLSCRDCPQVPAVRKILEDYKKKNF